MNRSSHSVPVLVSIAERDRFGEQPHEPGLPLRTGAVLVEW
ncbi:hypothetical protein [Nocardia paucivorans]|nr:hypothetical protein [Nocardia paucivorans]